MLEIENTGIYFEATATYDEVEKWVANNLDDYRLDLGLDASNLFKVNRHRSEIDIIWKSDDTVEKTFVIDVKTVITRKDMFMEMREREMQEQEDRDHDDYHERLLNH